MLRWRAALLRSAALAAIVGLLIAATARSAEVLILPLPRAAPAPAAKTNGLTVQVDTTAWVGSGYAPVKVTVTTATPSPSDRAFSVQVSSSRPRGGQSVGVGSEFELAAGATTASTVVRVPRFTAYPRLRFDFWDEGEHLPDLSHEWMLTRTGLPQSWISNRETLVVLHIIAGQKSIPQNPSWQGSLEMIRQPTGKYQPVDLFESSIDYSTWDAVLVSIDELTHIMANRPQAWTALRQWVAAGGNLWVYGLGKDFSRITELEELVGLLPAPLNKDGRAAPKGTPQWHVPTLSAIESAISQAMSPGGNYIEPRLKEQLAKDLPLLRDRLKQPPFALRPLGMGYLAAVDTVDPFKEFPAFWEILANQLSGRADWDTRHGVSFDTENNSFWNFLIPGVGLAPIGAFEVLITLFVILIGPVNYFLLRRRHKQSLLMFTVPAGAALATGGLLFYAILADGLAVRARTRSYTEIDQRRGEAACWSRIAYYPGLQPSGGLEFPLDTAVYPIEYQPDFNDYRSTRTRQIDEGQTRKFTRGWLPARTITQMLTVRARSATARVEIEPAEAGEAPRVTNRLGTRIEQLLIVANDGKLSWSDSVADGASAATQSIEQATAIGKLIALQKAQTLEFPPSWDNASHGSMFGFRHRSYYYYGRSGSNFLTLGHLMEESLLRCREVDALPPRSYVAVVEQSPEFELGLKQANVEASFHVIVGHW